MRPSIALLVLSLLLALLAPAAAHAAPDRREVQARKEFAAGNFQKSLDLFAELFAENPDPVYLRNIGRCYQQMGRPADAIRSFRYYLQRAESIEPGERAEVEGFIAELEKAMAEQPARDRPRDPPPPAARPNPAAGPAPVSTAPPPERLLVPPPPAEPVPTVGVVESDAPPAASPIYKRWWFWTAIGAVVVAGVVTAVAASGGVERGDCHGVVPCTGLGR